MRETKSKKQNTSLCEKLHTEKGITLIAFAISTKCLQH